MTQPFRLAAGGLIDRQRPLRFRFDGRDYSGHPGDTLASALLANGVKTVGRSFKYHRRRGIFSAGPEEPNALVRLREGDRAEPNTRATMVELFDGLVAQSQNRWPALGFDVLGINNALSPLFPAGFYYKTFMWPRSLWMSYEKFIRRAAGLGKASGLPDPDRYEHRHAHADLLVIGGGPAGLAAAAAAGGAGARVILVDERPAFGGSLRFERVTLDGAPGHVWAARAVAALASLPEVRLLPRTTAFGFFDHNVAGLIERIADHVAVPPPHAPRQRLWLVRARHVVFATGAIERPLVFADNDLPGIMLAGAARRYAGEYGVRVGKQAVVFTNNDDAYRTALDLAALGIGVAAIVDSRAAPHPVLGQAVRDLGIAIHAGHVVERAHGNSAVYAITIAPRGDTGAAAARRRIDCDLLCVSGGWNPAVHLHSQSGGKLSWRDDLAAFVPAAAKQKAASAGAARGTFELSQCIADGAAAGVEAAKACGFGAAASAPLPEVGQEIDYAIEPLWSVARSRRGKRFVDVQNDVTAEDVALAHRENYASVELLKRYTTLGMGTDQGKTSNVNGLAILAELSRAAIPEIGTTTFRPPYTPVALGAIAGPHVGKQLEPTRLTPLHDWHLAHDALMVEAGQWLRPRAYLSAGESLAAAWMREAMAVRNAVGLADVSTLGKIEVEGPDAAELLDRLYCNPMRSLTVGKARYGLMLREDGMVFDDGTCSRLSEHRFFVTTTTANAARVLAQMEKLLAVDWPTLRVVVTSVTDQWAQMALAGPDSRAVLAKAVRGCDMSSQAFPALGVRSGEIAGVPVRLFRVSYSGELAYEIAAPADDGQSVWSALLAVGKDFGISPYGLEAMGALRIEKGHVAGPELNGQTTPADLGLKRMVSTKKDFIGRRLLERPALVDPGRPTLVGLVPADGNTSIIAGAQLVAEERHAPPVPMLGHVTSSTSSPTLGHPIALGLLRDGARRHGQTMVAASPLTDSYVPVRIVEPCFYDPKGARQNG